jgi:hypothetical protein
MTKDRPKEHRILSMFYRTRVRHHTFLENQHGLFRLAKARCRHPLTFIVAPDM